VASPGVSAAGCIVAPYGCTANFIFTDGAAKYVGTARHCVDRKGQPVTMQVDTATLAVVGTVSHMTSGDGEPGNHWALIKIDPAVAAKWGVNPAVPIVGGPQGIYTGCEITALKYFGHGYGVAVAQGKPEFGVATARASRRRSSSSTSASSTPTAAPPARRRRTAGSDKTRAKRSRMPSRRSR
jgi:hypothetical protein